MEFTNIPNIKNKVSRIGLGTWVMGGSLWGGANEKDSIAAIHQAIEKGINFIDTAPAYGKGESEKVVGKALKQLGKRDQIILATKFGLNQETENVFRDSRKQSIKKEVEDSLRRLQVDYIDLFQVHWPDPTTPIQETAETLKELLQQGKIRAIGVSNYSVEEMKEFKKYAPLHTSQPPFNIFEQEAENTILAYCLKEEIATIGYSGLARGLLSGKMTKDRKFKDDDLRKGMDPKFQEPRFSQYVNAADALKAWVKNKYQRPLIALAVRWVLDKKVNVSLWGARNPEQLKDIDSVFGWKLNDQDFKEIDKIIGENVKDPIGPQFMAPPIRPNALLKTR
ncbi:MAG: aldo/keto reductase [Parachlamydiaceae bacterium]|nr:aldo/keto reductase [Parachlamydiaceae bacterium]